jgi:hypothetical protein
LEWALAQPARDTFDVTLTAIELNRDCKRKNKSKSSKRSRTGREAGGQGEKQEKQDAEGEKQGKQKQKKQKERARPSSWVDALSDQLSDCTQNSSIPMTEKITFETFEWEQT